MVMRKREALSGEAEVCRTIKNNIRRDSAIKAEKFRERDRAQADIDRLDREITEWRKQERRLQSLVNLPSGAFGMSPGGRIGRGLQAVQTGADTASAMAATRLVEVQGKLRDAETELARAHRIAEAANR